MNILFLKGFNNYFNRIVKKYSSLENYRSYSSSYLDVGNLNFSPNDSVTTEIVIGGPTQLENNNPISWDITGSPDYAVCYENSTIISRWFVIDTVRTRNGQYSVSLKRDSVVDNFDNILNAPCFVKKATITDEYSPLIFSNEGSTYNQIKQSETLLTDKSGIPWIVGYIPRDKKFDTAIQATTIYTGTADYSVNGLTNWDYYDFYHYPNKYSVIDRATIKTAFDAETKYHTQINNINGYITWVYDGNANYTMDIDPYTLQDTNPINALHAEIWVNMNIETVRRIVFNAAGTTVGTNFTYEQYLELLQLDGKTLLDTSTNKVYQITLSYGDSVGGIISNGTSYTPVIELSNMSELISITKNGNALLYNFVSRQVYIQLTEKVVGIQTTIPDNRYHLHDQPFDMFCMPYGDIDIYSNNQLVCHNNKIAALNIATEISATMGNSSVYDIQLLPYCPIQNIITDDGDIDYGSLIVNDITTTGNQSTVQTVMFWASSSQFSFNIDKSISINRILDKPITKMFENKNLINIMGSFTTVSPNNYELTYNIPASTFALLYGVPEYSLDTLDITDISLVSLTLASGSKHAVNVTLSATKYGDRFQITIRCMSGDNLTQLMRIQLNANFTITYLDENKVLSLKVSNETDLYRLCSPNWSGYFDFSVAKMGGTCEFFHVDCSYKPFQPYIHIVPNLKGLYGQNVFNGAYDARGLILGGDFSLPQLSNAWANYAVNNKNYQQIFDRQMQNLDINNHYQEVNDIFGAVTGAVQGTAQGAMAGGMLSGSPIGAAIGGAIGGITSTVAGIVDVNRNAALRRENKQYQIDQFNYSLGNIKAIPTALTKISSINNNNRLFPVLEYYTSTNEEKEILKNNLKYDGYTIMAIGTLGDYDEGYFKGDIIRLDSLNDDSHIANDIYAELSRGIYLS